jgi:hypothetical protein
MEVMDAAIWPVSGGFHAHDERFNLTVFGRTEEEARQQLHFAVLRAQRLATVALVTRKHDEEVG